MMRLAAGGNVTDSFTVFKDRFILSIRIWPDGKEPNIQPLPPIVTARTWEGGACRPVGLLDRFRHTVPRAPTTVITHAIPPIFDFAIFQPSGSTPPATRWAAIDPYPFQ